MAMPKDEYRTDCFVCQCWLFLIYDCEGCCTILSYVYHMQCGYGRRG